MIILLFFIENLVNRMVQGFEQATLLMLL